MSNDSVCVVGVSGFVGSHVAAELLSRGYNVQGSLRNASSDAASWLDDSLPPLASNGAHLTLHSADLADKPALLKAMDNCSGVIMCAGVERQEPATIDLMVGGAQAILDNALTLGIERAVFTSSTGSTNPPSGEPDCKNELEHWSDPEQQQAAGKFSPAAKTLMDQTVLAGMENHADRLRTVVFNPSMIAGPAFQPEPVASLRAFQAILQGSRFADTIPNGSMSLIDVRDLAKLHVNALELDGARGRYFGVKQSWHWRDILDALKEAVPSYKPPRFPADQTPVAPTQFDLSRQRTLGHQPRGLAQIIEGIVTELKRRQML